MIVWYVAQNTTERKVRNEDKNSKEDNEDWTKAFLVIDDKKIWIGDEVDGSFHDMTAKYGDTNSFEFKTFQEYS